MSLIVVRYFVFKLTVGTGETDGQTDGMWRVMRPPMGGLHRLC